MTANTRLTKEQKQDRKELKKFLRELNGEIGTCDPFTVAKASEFKGSKMAQFSVSMCSQDESKFRRKVGEYHALTKLLLPTNNYVILPAVISAQSFAEYLNDAFLSAQLSADNAPTGGIGGSFMDAW